MELIPFRPRNSSDDLCLSSCLYPSSMGEGILKEQQLYNMMLLIQERQHLHADEHHAPGGHQHQALPTPLPLIREERLASPVIWGWCPHGIFQENSILAKPYPWKGEEQNSIFRNIDLNFSFVSHWADSQLQIGLTNNFVTAKNGIVSERDTI